MHKAINVTITCGKCVVLQDVNKHENLRCASENPAKFNALVKHSVMHCPTGKFAPCDSRTVVNKVFGLLTKSGRLGQAHETLEEHSKAKQVKIGPRQGAQIIPAEMGSAQVHWAIIQTCAARNYCAMADACAEMDCCSQCQAHCRYVQCGQCSRLCTKTSQNSRAMVCMINTAAQHDQLQLSL